MTVPVRTPTAATPEARNGWNLNDFHAAIDMVAGRPEAGRLTFRGRVAWDGGFAGDARALEIEQLGEVMERRFTLRGDHPPELLGQDTGATAVETLLAALGSCMMGTYAAQATARGVDLRALEVDVEGTIDLNGFFGLRQVPPGVSDLRLTFRVDSDADEPTLRELADLARRHSPVHDSLTRPLTVAAAVERLG